MQTVHISKMTGKLQGLHSISTNTLTNQFCIKQNSADNGGICTLCYSVSMLSTFRKSAAPALQRNSDLLARELLTDRQVPFINASIFRFSAHGELINEIHLQNLIKIAELNEAARLHFGLKEKIL